MKNLCSFAKIFFVCLGLLSSCDKNIVTQNFKSKEKIQEKSQGIPEPAIGPRAVRIVFRGLSTAQLAVNSRQGSFDAQDADKETAKRYFDASSGDEITKPEWIESVKVGITSDISISATESRSCARFAESYEASTKCRFGETGTTTNDDCGASEGWYRVSEVDCIADTTVPVVQPLDSANPVSIKVSLNRNPTVLAPYENLMAVLEYSAAARKPGPATPTDCFVSGNFVPDRPECSEQTFKVFLRHSASETVQPYLMIVPPALGYIDGAANSGEGRGGSGTGTKQFFVPLRSDGKITAIEIGRTSGSENSIELNNICSPNSAQCVGAIFYSLTLYRI